MINKQMLALKKIARLRSEIEKLNGIISTYTTLNGTPEKGVIKGKFDDGFNLDFINDEALNLFGYTSKQFTDEVIENSGSDELVGDIQAVYTDIRNLVASGNPIRFKTKIKRRDGEIIWIVGDGNVVKDKKSEISCVFTFCNSATMQPKAKELIDLQSVSQNMGSGILICKLDEKFTIIYANEELADILGYPYDEMQRILGCGYMELAVPADRDYKATEVMNHLSNNCSFFVTYRMIKKNGEEIWVEEKGVIIERSGQQNILQCIVKDITYQKKKEDALIISDKRYQITMEHSNISTFDYDIRSKIMNIYRGESGELQTPIIIENAVEAFVASGLIFQHSIEDYRKLFRRVDAGDPISEAIIYGYNGDGEASIFELSLTNIFGHRGNQLIAIGIRRDITEKMQLQREKEFANTFTSDSRFAYEANITKDEIITYNKKWQDELPQHDIDLTSYTAFINWICDKVILPEDASEIRSLLSNEQIMEDFANGKRLISLTYRKVIKDIGYRWVENTITIIKDELSGDINIRCYLLDVNDKKEKELAILQEQKNYEKMLSKTTIVYEVNISKNHVVSGNKAWSKLFDNEQPKDYNKIIEELLPKWIHNSDQKDLARVFSSQSVLSSYKSGKDQIAHNCRVLDSSGKYIWMSCKMNLFEDPYTGDVTAYTYIENIDAEKRKELALIYKTEHDALTDMYNKETTEKRIREFLASDGAPDGDHAFIIIDIDRFKDINDNFGHSFGDAIISQIAGKILGLFREEDIIGRIGGDEFVVFMKNILKKKIALEKSQEICDSVLDVFTQNEIDYELSVSVGIAFYGPDGETYQELYRHSDSALYFSKENGRNQYTLYSEDIRISTANTTIKEINADNIDEAKVFSSNISEYVFRILYEAQDKKSSISSVLELIGKHFGVSRAYIFEDSKDNKYTFNTFEWCNENVPPHLLQSQNTPYDSDKIYTNTFNSDGVFYVADVAYAAPPMQELLNAQGILSTLKSLIVYGGKRKGFIGFDKNDSNYISCVSDISELKSIANILGLFITDMRIQEENIATKNMAMSIIDTLNSYTYVCDLNHTVLFISAKMKSIMTGEAGDKCYRLIYNRDTPCKDCPMIAPTREGATTYSANWNSRIKETATDINWNNGERVFLVDIAEVP